ncbi:GGDEF domain-containing protein [Marinobacter daepoensis]|uniref:diguanylate cyclase n=1 Tax=Marinobacter daepoensis TaxID=262077 RepID=A0ABS3BI87_9GAMM|nr:GGDEF domain-containing protein [Marinobacter daepoensis]MBN7771559.1 GGDEF domain-containing protein [Marinobacter daepoensis]MBY6080159.1 GGDEF domain-containing protein [Marinobacter daepoensis]
MTETRLRTWTHASGYTLAALFTAALALQNLRYGFYQLFYTALAMSALMMAGLIYTCLCRRQQLSAPGHLAILTALNSGLVAAVITTNAPGISHWAMPLILLNLLILPLRHGLALSTLLLIPVLIVTWLSDLPGAALLTSIGLLAILAITSLYIWHYDHMTQSAQDLAITDPVTGAHNARFLDDTLQKEISRAIATGHPLSVVSLNIDHAEEIHDLHGKAGMQNLLQEMTATLFEIIRAGDSLYSVNGSQFFLVLPFTPEEGVRVIAERIRRTITEHDWQDVGQISASLGCTTRGNGDTSTASLRERAMTAMYEAQKRGADAAWFSPGESIKA